MSAADTIFALSSAAGRAGVAVIRLSGPKVRTVLERVCGGVPASRQATLRHLTDPATGLRIDSGLVLFFAGPTSFTGEDVAEFQVHGSSAVLRKLLGLLALEPGLRLAQSGEFTRRALFNGKLDLVEVEALGDLLESETELQRRLAVSGAAEMRRLSADWRERLLDLRANIEARIDFSDEGDVPERLDSQTERSIAGLAQDIETVAASLRTSERIRRGFRIALLGPPNAGKSSLINALARRDIAIVAASPGTTRDVLEVQLDLDGVAVVISDAAGIRDTLDPVEAEGVRRALSAGAIADLVLWLSPIDSPAKCPDPCYLEIRTKCDLAANPMPEHLASPQLSVSSQTGTGLAELTSVLRMLALRDVPDIGTGMLVRTARQAGALAKAAAALRAAAGLDEHTLDLRAEDLRIACDSLDEFVGKVNHEDVLSAIFARFCIGK